MAIADAPPLPPVVEAPVPAPEESAPAASAAEAVAPLVASMSMAAPVVLTGDLLSPASDFKSPHVAILKTVLEDALNRLLLPSLEREIRNELTDEAEHHAVQVFARNLRSLLLQPPLRGKRVLAIDPGFRTGCKVAALDEFGNLLEHSVIYPFSPPSKKKGRRPGRGERPDRSNAPAAAPAAAPSAEQATPTPVESAPAPETPAPETPTIAAEHVPESPTPPSVAEPPSEPHPTSDTTAVPETPPSPESPPTHAAPVAAESTPSAPVATEPTPSEPVAAEAPAAGPAEPEVPEPPPVDPKIEAKAKLLDLIRKHGSQVIALGNGTGCRETEEIIADLISTSATDVAYIVVNEAGASFYSVSPVGREEFPSLDATTRGTISIGRRLQDPLSELVKVDPQNIGVGLYQHDMSGKSLKDSLDAVVESCVNQVGVDLNTASVPLLRHVSGLNQLVARELVDYRKQHGPFASREQLMQVPSFGPGRFTQSAGFLKIPAAGNVFDRTWIHPESYAVAEKLLAELGATPAILDDAAGREEFHAKLRSVNIDETARKLGVGGPTLYDIVQALLRPGRDPREEMPPPIFKKGILRLEDLQPGMELRGTVLNVVDFGAFVDIGLKDSGLVHISQMANRYIKSPYDVVAVNDVVTVWVKSIDAATRHVSLTMIKPGTEQKPPERRTGGGRPQGGPGGPRGPGGGRPPRSGPRPGGPGGPGGPPGGPGSQQGGPPPGYRTDNRPPRDPRDNRGPGGPPNRGPRPPRQGDRTPQPAAQMPPPPPPRPRREPPKPKLSKEALEGKAPLRTFGELSALFAAKREDKPKNEPPKVETPKETPAASEPPLTGGPSPAEGAPPAPPAEPNPESPPKD